MRSRAEEIEKLKRDLAKFQGQSESAERTQDAPHEQDDDFRAAADSATEQDSSSEKQQHSIAGADAGEGYIDGLHMHHPSSMLKPTMRMPGMPGGTAMVAHWVDAYPVPPPAHWADAYPVPPQSQWPGGIDTLDSSFFAVPPPHDRHHAAAMQHHQHMSGGEAAPAMPDAPKSRQTSRSGGVSKNRLSGSHAAGSRSKSSPRPSVRSRGTSPLPSPDLSQSAAYPGAPPPSGSGVVPWPSLSPPLDEGTFSLNKFINFTARACNTGASAAAGTEPQGRPSTVYANYLTPPATGAPSSSGPHGPDMQDGRAGGHAPIPHKRGSFHSSTSRAPSAFSAGAGLQFSPPSPTVSSPARTGSPAPSMHSDSKTAVSVASALSSSTKTSYSYTPPSSSRLSLAPVPPAVTTTEPQQPLAPSTASPTASPNASSSLLHLAVTGNHPEILALLLQHGEIPLDVRDAAGYTPLQKAVTAGRTEMVGMLLEAGANVVPHVAVKDFPQVQNPKNHCAGRSVMLAERRCHRRRGVCNQR